LGKQRNEHKRLFIAEEEGDVRKLKGIEDRRNAFLSRELGTKKQRGFTGPRCLNQKPNS